MYNLFLKRSVINVKNLLRGVVTKRSVHQRRDVSRTEYSVSQGDKTTDQGRCSGMIGMVHRNEVDVGIIANMISQRLDCVDFSMPITSSL